MNSTLSSPVVSQAQHTPFVMGSPLASPVVPQTQQTPFVMDSTLSSPVVSQIQQTPFVMGSTLSSPVVSQLQQSPLSMPQYEVSSSYTPLSVPFSPEPRTHVTFPTDYNNFTPSNGGMSANHVRGEVQKRTSGKAYGVIFTDMQVSSVRGWPEKIYSDPGSQLIGAGRELEEAWKNMDRQSLQKSGTKNGSTWIFGPADSPWYQGAVESLVKSAKRAIHFAVNNQRLSVPEFLTLCYEVSNLMNERPIGAQPSIDSTLNILTPNSLLLGRARAINPLGWQPHNSNIRTRYHLVQAVTEDVWKRWTELYAPTLIKD
ncbi:hypothetical protein QZH41_014230 [Actinostola sp. cb2023]|nr:hypothetical protein QZH41_014230 [Actinostola sp. cb2023]